MRKWIIKVSKEIWFQNSCNALGDINTGYLMSLENTLCLINTGKTRRFLIYSFNFCHYDQKRVFMNEYRSFTLKAIFIIFIYNFK